MSEPMSLDPVQLPIGPRVESYIEGIHPDVDPNEVSPSPKAESPDHDSIYKDITEKELPMKPDPENPGKSIEVSYTNLVVDAAKCWLCPKCRRTADDTRTWALTKRGYVELPATYDRLIPKCYEPESVRTRSVYFRNPSGVGKCMNMWDEGLRGFPCDFDREVTEGFRRKDLEAPDKCGTPVGGASFGYCPTCAFPREIVETNEELKAYMKDETQNAYDEVNDRAKEVYVLKKNPWDGEVRYLRLLVYNGDEESLKCPSMAWGKGTTEGSQTARCPGRYGAPVTFWEYRTGEDGRLECFPYDWQPGGVDPDPATPPLNPEDLALSSDGISSDPDQGQGQGEWYSSS